MTLRTITLAALMGLLAAAPLPALAQDTSQPTNHCDSGDKIDNTTADQARKKLEAAGYSDITGLNKGCDNVWHASARANGNQVNVMVAPDGSVHQETN